MPRVDHVVYGVADLDAAARRFEEEYGLPSIEGGEHAGFGTHNRLIGLGDSYIELLAGPPVDALLDGGGDRWLGWMIRTDDIDAEAARVGVGVMAMSRTRPDGVELRWRLAGWGFTGLLPVFIQWDTPWQPGGDARLAWLDVSISPTALHDWVGDADDLPVRTTEGAAGLHAVGIHLPGGGDIVIR